jgi:hypothetical protein
LGNLDEFFGIASFFALFSEFGFKNFNTIDELLLFSFVIGG